MINYKDFWLSLQLGKWRSESIRRQFQSNVSHFLFTRCYGMFLLLSRSGLYKVSLHF